MFWLHLIKKKKKKNLNIDFIKIFNELEYSGYNHNNIHNVKKKSTLKITKLNKLKKNFKITNFNKFKKKFFKITNLNKLKKKIFK
jgi:hypothetical protein